ncbi:MAG TPA: MFS transporter [Gemmatales bacterium]|nr:MFS transporter [Gemmatales bacterium]
MESRRIHSSFAALLWPEFRRLFISTAFTTLGYRALTLVIGYQVYELTANPLDLGMLGLVEAIPALSLALFGGHVADRMDRRNILVYTLSVLTLCAAGFAIISAIELGHHQLWLLYTVIFVAGIARGFGEPASGAIEAEVVPRELYVNASAWMASAWLSCAVLGPVVGGICYGLAGPVATYVMIAVFFACAWMVIIPMEAKPAHPSPEDESIWQSIAVGVKYVASNQILVGSMALDLFAVLFGGAMALLPVFATDILHVGPIHLGFMNAAPAAGAFVMMMWATRHPPSRNAGRTLLVSVFAFGITMIVFALSTNFYLSLIMLTLSGIFDGISVVIRRAILRLESPDHLRGRVAAVSMIFIGSSNEIGAFESGVAASLLGTVPSVWLGGLVTLLVVAVTAWKAPKLRRLHIEMKQQKEAALIGDTTKETKPVPAAPEATSP